MTVPTLAAVLLLYATPLASIDVESEEQSHKQGHAIEVGGLPFIEAIAPADLARDIVAKSEDAQEEELVSDTPVAENEIVVIGGMQALRADPLQEVNLMSYQAVQSMDQALVAPIAKGYKHVVPEPVRDGLGNVLRNVSEPVNFLNFLLQLKVGKAVETVGRFAVNTTIGVGGLFDVAKKKPFKLPYRRNGFANTMGFYGIKPGPYFYLPLLGPTTLRDLAGNSLDLLILPTVVGQPFDRTAYAIPSNVIMQLNARIERDAEIQRLQQESPNPYAETRTLYLEMRQSEIDALKTKRTVPPVDPIAETVNQR